MSEKRFELVNGIITDMQDNERMYGIFELVDKLNELCEENEQLRKYNGQLKKRLEKINGGYGHLTHRNGLTANEWLIESQEKELQKKNEQISDWIEQHSKDVAKIGEQQATISALKEENEQLRKENVFLAKQRNYWKSKCAEWMGVKEENLSLRCVKMSEKRFVCIDIGYGDDWYIIDDGKRLSEMEIVDLLNEMNEDIQYLNAFLVEQGLAEEYIRWKGDD